MTDPRTDLTHWTGQMLPSSSTSSVTHIKAEWLLGSNKRHRDGIV